MSYYLVCFLSLPVLLMLAPNGLCLSPPCDLERIRIPGDIILSAIVGLREPRDGVCGDRYIPGEIQVASAMVWATEKLKGTPGADSFIPGRSVGIELADDCSLERKSVQIGVNTLLGAGSPDIATCSNATCQQETAHIAGIIHTSTSQTASKLAELYRGTNIPVIGTAATAAALSNKTNYPTFVRTVPSDIEQMMVLINTVKQLNWTYIAVVYTDDTYGKEGLRLLKEFAAKDETMCIMMTKGISQQETRFDEATNVLASIATRLSRTRHDQLGVVYIGQLAQAQLLTQRQFLAGRNPLYKDFLSLYWIMSEAVGTNMQLNPNNRAGGLITIALSSPGVSEFKRYFLHQLEKVIRPTTMSKTPMSRLYEKYVESVHDCKIDPPATNLCSDLEKGALEKSFEQQDYVASAIDAVYVLASAVKKEICLDNPACDRIFSLNQSFEKLASLVKTSTLDYSTIDVRFVPYEFHVLRRTVKFDDTGDVITDKTVSSYDIYNVWEEKNVKVGEYKDHNVSLDKTLVKMKNPSHLVLTGNRLPRSLCHGSCPECINRQDIPFTYIPGDLIIIGLFSLSENGGEFTCGKFRRDTVSYLTFESFSYAIHSIREYYPTMNFGGLAFDDCYSPLRAQYILANFLSGQYKLMDKNTNQPIDPSKVVLVVGPLSSGVTLQVADILTRLNIPQISYGASSTDLDDRQKYPYFLRTVPSDESQAEAIVEILDKMNWTAVSVIYMNNNYGLRGFRTFQDMANKKGICIRDPPIPISNSMDKREFKTIVSDLRWAHTQVILYFGIDTLAKILLNGLKELIKDDEFIFIGTEAWGQNEQLLTEGRGTIAKGAIILHLDTSASLINLGFKKYMETKNPYTCKNCEWLKLFWQDHFKCDLEDSFTGAGNDRKVCNLQEHGQLEAAEKQDQRVIPTVTAVTAAAKAIKVMVHELCAGKVCPVNLRRVTNGAKLLTDRIANVTLDTSDGQRIFSSTGDGNIGFEILNVQYKDGQYTYIPVGHFSDSGLDFNPSEVVLYDKLNQRRSYSQVETKCVSSQCEYCEKQLEPYKATPKPTTTIPPDTQPITEPPNNSFIAPTVIAALAVIALAIAVIFFVVLYRRKQKKQTPHETRQMQEVGHGNAAFDSSEINLAHPVNFRSEPIYAEPDMVNTNNHRVIGPDDSCRGIRGSGSGSAGTLASSSCTPPANLIRQQCICVDSQLFRHINTAAGRVLVCEHCRGIVTLNDRFTDA